MSYTYATFQSALAAYMAVPNNSVADAQFVAALPSITDYAELRIYRDLDVLHQSTEEEFQSTVGNRRLSITATGSQLQILTVETVGVDLPARTNFMGSTPKATALIPLWPVALEYIDAIFGSGVRGVPQYFAMQSDQLLVLGPAPDQAYFIHVVGEARPLPIALTPPMDGSQTNFLLTALPDLFLAAAMIHASGFQRNFSAQGDDPRQAMSWEQQYQLLLASAKSEELRKRFHGWGQLSSDTPPPPTQSPGPPP